MLTQSLFSENEAYQRKNTMLQTENETLCARLSLDAEKIKNLESQNTWFMEQIRALKRTQFGKKSEAWVSEEQLTMTF